MVLDQDNGMGSRWRGDSQEWQARLDQARTSQEVLEVTRAFVSLLGVADISEIPEGVMPGLLDNPKHIEHYAVKLAHAYLNHEGARAQGLHRISSYFTKAALRIMQIEGRINPEIREQGAGVVGVEQQGSVSASEGVLTKQI